MANTVTRTCEHCQRTFKVPAWRIKQGTPAKFCSVACHNLAAKRPLQDRFNDKVGSPTATGCLPWLASKDKDGYGCINEGGRYGQQRRAHRIAYILANGTIPDGMLVLHRCDNPSCVNHEHLFLGSNVDNMLDKSNKQRQCRGAEQRLAILTDAKVRQLRKDYKKGNVTQKELAVKYGVKQAQISAIVRRRAWKHVS